MSEPDSSSDESGLRGAVDSFLDGLDGDALAAAGMLLPPALDPRASEEPTILDDDFELGDELGAGAMGVVYEARQRSVADRRVAVKVIHSHRASRAHQERFRREIAAISRLDHPDIVPVYASGIDEGRPYYAMKLVEGTTLARVIARLRRTTARPTKASEVAENLRGPYAYWVASVGFRLADALEHAHEQGLVHRDVKPGNVMITPDGNPVLTDFGLAKDEMEETLTVPGLFLGTPAYASPEQVSGARVDSRSDVYSLGGTLYELLTLRRMFDASTGSELERKIRTEPPPRLPRSVPADLRTICMCALAKRPAQRYPSPGAMARDLRAFLEGEPIAARPPGVLARGFGLARRHPQVVLVAFVASLAWIGVRVSDRVRAGQAVDRGLAALEVLDEERAELVELRRKFDALFEASPLEYEETFLSAELLRDELEEQRGVVEAGFRSAELDLMRAFEHVAGYPPARRALADLFAAELDHACRHLADVRDPPRVDRLSERLREYGRPGDHDLLLDETGDAEIVCDVPGVTIRVRAGGELHEGPSPLRIERIPEGSHVASLLRDGSDPVDLPFLVRRRGCYRDSRVLPPREVVVRDLPAAGEVPPGMVFIPEGWTLVEDDPVRWTFVESFAIGEDEVTYAEWLDWLNRLPRNDYFEQYRGTKSAAWKPRYADEYSGLHVVCEDEDWHLRDEYEPDWPVRGLTMMEMNAYATTLGFLDPSPDWAWSLPSVAQWTRAARGADARVYPWGGEFDDDACVSFLHHSRRGSAQPQPVRTAPRDISPFGVHDMAGSIAEATLDAFGPYRGETAVCGGSYRSWDRDRLRIGSVRPVANNVANDIGFRLVRSRVRHPEAAPIEVDFRDDFDRPEGPGLGLGDGWRCAPGSPAVYPGRRAAAARCAISTGRLVCEGGEGHFAWPTSVWHPIAVSADDGVTVRARILSGSQPELWLAGGVQSEADTEARLKLAGETTHVTYRSASAFPDVFQASSGTPVATGGPCLFELRIVGASLEGRVWPEDEDRPEVGVALELPAFPRGLRYVGFTSGPDSGAVEVDWVEVEPGR